MRNWSEYSSIISTRQLKIRNSYKKSVIRQFLQRLLCRQIYLLYRSSNLTTATIERQKINATLMLLTFEAPFSRKQRLAKPWSSNLSLKGVFAGYELDSNSMNQKLNPSNGTSSILKLQVMKKYSSCTFAGMSTRVSGNMRIIWMDLIMPQSLLMAKAKTNWIRALLEAMTLMAIWTQTEKLSRYFEEPKAMSKYLPYLMSPTVQVSSLSFCTCMQSSAHLPLT
ncbi:hypothetical protein FGO68_gene65 [Halteria grandinella]|uniref:Uncharacterized protein n=1 Tax=Halteria grandinella TaxID=5974 RepID=A0A8J8NGQ7_HALGN|nr:hypothetical protein FGO68_gene65 [Halteria grandinella]